LAVSGENWPAPKTMWFPWVNARAFNAPAASAAWASLWTRTWLKSRRGPSCPEAAASPATAEAIRSASCSNASPGSLTTRSACGPSGECRRTWLKSRAKRGSSVERTSGARGRPGERSTSWTTGGAVFAGRCGVLNRFIPMA
jgi:hypothetical protein